MIRGSWHKVVFRQKCVRSLGIIIWQVRRVAIVHTMDIAPVSHGSKTLIQSAITLLQIRRVAWKGEIDRRNLLDDDCDHGLNTTEDSVASHSSSPPVIETRISTSCSRLEINTMSRVVASPGQHSSVW